jgi:asparagine synthase (glutamine-hydrolysing)
MLLTGIHVVAPAARQPEFHTYSARPELAARLLSVAELGPIRVSMLGQLHYRAPLVARSSRVRVQRADPSDAELIACLVNEYGLAALGELEGDYALACFDASAQRLVCARDPLGAYPLFWTERQGSFAVSSSIRTLHPFSPSQEVDPEYVAAFLAYPTDAISELPITRTACQGVQRILPGERVDFDLVRRTARTIACSAWDVTRDPTPTNDLAAAGELVRSRLEDAVGERLSRNAHTASHFSGGLDSTGIALMAHAQCAARGGAVHALSLVYRREVSLRVEHDYIQAALEANPGVVPHSVDADDLLDFSEHEQLPLLDEPAPAIARFALMGALVNAAQVARADTVLSGDGADHLFARDPGSLIEDRLRAGELDEAWTLITRISYASSQSALRIAADVVRSMAAAPLAALKLGHARRVPFERMKGADLPPWLDRAYVTRHALDAPITDARCLTGGDLTPEVVRASAGSWFNWHIGMPRGVLISRPFWDARIVKIGLALPAEVHIQPGTMKPVLHAALRDVLPPKLLARRRKTHLGILNAGFTRHRAVLLRLIERAAIPPGILDRALLRDALEKAGLGVYAEARSVGRLRLALSYLSWASRRAEWLERPFPLELRREFVERPRHYRQLEDARC